MPASAITSASPSFWQVMPLAPASICIFASIGLLWVLMCGRLATPAASQAAWMRAMLRSTLSMSITAQGVPYSRATLAASGVVMASPCLVRAATFAESALRLFYLFAQYFQFQPAVLGGGEFLMCGGHRSRGLVELLAIPGIEIGVVEHILLPRDLGLQLFDRLRQRLQRVLFIKIQPALWCCRRRSSQPGFPAVVGCSLHWLALQVGAALRQHIAVAAGIFDPAPVAFRHDYRCYDTIEEVAVMADQDHRAVVVAQHFLQHVEGFQVEVVGRLVQYQQVGRFCQRSRQHHPSALAAGQHFERRAHLFLRKQEILHVADNVFGLAADHDVIATSTGQGLRERRFRIEAFAMLVERRHL